MFRSLLICVPKPIKAPKPVLKREGADPDRRKRKLNDTEVKDKRRKGDCFAFLDGCCTRGNTCRFNHPADLKLETQHPPVAALKSENFKTAACDAPLLHEAVAVSQVCCRAPCSKVSIPDVPILKDGCAEHASIMARFPICDGGGAASSADWLVPRAGIVAAAEVCWPDLRVEFGGAFAGSYCQELR